MCCGDDPWLCNIPALTISASTSSWTYQGKEVPFAPVPWSATSDLISHDLRSAFTKMWPSAEMTVEMIKRLDSKNFKFKYEHIKANGGHTDVFDHFGEVLDFLKENF